MKTIDKIVKIISKISKNIVKLVNKMVKIVENVDVFQNLWNIGVKFWILKKVNFKKLIKNSYNFWFCFYLKTSSTFSSGAGCILVDKICSDKGRWKCVGELVRQKIQDSQKFCKFLNPKQKKSQIHLWSLSKWKS